MIHHERSLEIEATPDAIWSVLGRFMHIDEFAPSVISVDALTKGHVGIGAQRRCHFDNGTSMAEEVIEWQPKQGYRVRLFDVEAMPLNEATAGIDISPLGAGRSRVTWSFDYEVKYGPLGWLMGQTMMKAMMDKVLDANLKGLADRVGSHAVAA